MSGLNASGPRGAGPTKGDGRRFCRRSGASVADARRFDGRCGGRRCRTPLREYGPETGFGQNPAPTDKRGALETAADALEQEREAVHARIARVEKNKPETSR